MTFVGLSSDADLLKRISDHIEVFIGPRAWIWASVYVRCVSASDMCESDFDSVRDLS